MKAAWPIYRYELWNSVQNEVVKPLNSHFFCPFQQFSMDSSLSSADSDDEGIGDKNKKKKMKKLKKRKKKVRVSAPPVGSFAEAKLSSSDGRKVCCALQDPVRPERTESDLQTPIC